MIEEKGRAGEAQPLYLEPWEEDMIALFGEKLKL